MISCNQESPTSTNTTHPGGQQEQVRGNPRRVEDGPTLQQTARRTCFNSSAVVATRGDPRHGGHHWWLRRRCPSCPPGNWIIKPLGAGATTTKRTGGQPGSASPPPDLTRGWWAATPSRRVFRVAGRQRPTPHRWRHHSLRVAASSKRHHRTSMAVWACVSGVPRRRHASRSPRSASILSAPTGLRCQPCRGASSCCGGDAGLWMAHRDRHRSRRLGITSSWVSE